MLFWNLGTIKAEKPVQDIQEEIEVSTVEEEVVEDSLVRTISSFKSTIQVETEDDALMRRPLMQVAVYDTLQKKDLKNRIFA